MGKEADLFKAVKNNDQNKLQKLFLPEKGYQVKKISQLSPGNAPGGRIRLHLDHINIDCIEPTTGYTPLITAVLHGHKEVVDTLLFHSASVDHSDNKGNTPLHMAVFSGQLELVDLLLQNNAKVNLQNSDGNTPLHILCQSDSENRVAIMLRLLQRSPLLYMKNKNQESPLDIAAMFNKKDAVSALLDHDTSLRYNTTAIIEASIRGYTDIVHLLLDYGVNPNGISDLKETGPLQEATRFVRLKVAEVLLKYGAAPSIKNLKNEVVIAFLDVDFKAVLGRAALSSESIAKEHPNALAEKFIKMFEEYAVSGATCSPKFIDTSILTPKPAKCYPLLPTDTSWSRNSPEYCNSCTARHPNTNILDGNLQTLWLIQEVHHAWTVLDLQRQHTLTGVTIHGWDSDKMVKCFEIQKGQDLSGPWITVGSFTCKREGSSDPKENAVPQHFTGFEDSSRYWRFHVLDNHGGNYTCFQCLALHGADDRIIQALASIDLSQYTDEIITKGYNTYKKFLTMGKETISGICKNADHYNVITNCIRVRREKELPLTYLRWVKPPPYSITIGESVPDLVVKGDNTRTDELQLYIDGHTGVLSGQLKSRLCADEEFSNPSQATFSRLVFNKCGKYRIKVQPVAQSSIVLLAPEEIEIKSKSKLTPDMENAFRDMESMLMDLQTSLEHNS